MRLDKLTTKFQQAFADAQSLAIGRDNQFMEPVHLLLALLRQEDGGTASLLSRAGANVQRLREACTRSVEQLPKVEGHGGEVQISRELSNLLNLTDKEAQKKGDQFVASELFVLAPSGAEGRHAGEAGRLLKEAGGPRKSNEHGIAPVRAVASGSSP